MQATSLQSLTQEDANSLKLFGVLSPIPPESLSWSPSNISSGDFSSLSPKQQHLCWWQPVAEMTCFLCVPYSSHHNQRWEETNPTTTKTNSQKDKESVFLWQWENKGENPLGILAILLAFRKNPDNTQRQRCLAVLGGKIAVNNPERSLKDNIRVTIWLLMVWRCVNMNFLLEDCPTLSLGVLHLGGRVITMKCIVQVFLLSWASLDGQLHLKRSLSFQELIKQFFPAQKHSYINSANLKAVPNIFSAWY